jgi:hypothetical protein
MKLGSHAHTLLDLREMREKDLKRALLTWKALNVAANQEQGSRTVLARTKSRLRRRPCAMTGACAPRCNIFGMISQMTQMPLAKRNDVVKTIPPDRYVRFAPLALHLCAPPRPAAKERQRKGGGVLEATAIQCRKTRDSSRKARPLGCFGFSFSLAVQACVQAGMLEEHVLQHVAGNIARDPRRFASVEERHGVEIGGSEGDADMAYAPDLIADQPDLTLDEIVDASGRV